MRSSPIRCGRRTAKGSADQGSGVRKQEAPLDFRQFEGGLREAGHPGEGFCFDNELPRHRVWLEPYSLADRLVTCGEYAEFMADGGYRKPELWLSAGWDAVKANGWRAPLYWTEEDGGWSVFTLRGELPLEQLAAAPVSQVSYYEADAYARWAGRRLPTEFEWEAAAEGQPVEGNLLDSGRLMPVPVHRTRPKPERYEVLRGLLGVDEQRLPGLSRLSAAGRHAGRVQRQIHERADGAARRIVRHASPAHPLELPQFLLPRDAMAVFRHPAGVVNAPAASN